MNTPANAIPGSFGMPTAAPVTGSSGRAFYWSVLREVWEYRSIYMAPLIVAGVIVIATSLSTLAAIWEPALRAEPGQRGVAEPYDLAALLIMGAAFLVAIFYCVDALHGERRDRSILFWKSLPVSDWTAVLAKFSIPVLVLPAVAFVVTVATHTSMLLWSTFIHAVSGSGAAGTHLLLVQTWVMLLYHLFAVHGLWYAPFYGWLLLVSAWAKRAALLWAVISVAAIAIAERILLGSRIFLSLLEGRLMDGPAGNFGPGGGNVLMPPLSQLTPGRFLISWGLWAGLLLSALFLTLAVRLRRQRGPI